MAVQFPLRHPHLALVVGLAVTADEAGRRQELRFAVMTPTGEQMATAQANVVASGPSSGRDTVLTFALDLWNLSFPAAGDYDIRIHIDGEERKRLPLVVEQRRAAARKGAPAATAPVPPFPPPTGKA